MSIIIYLFRPLIFGQFDTKHSNSYFRKSFSKLKKFSHYDWSFQDETRERFSRKLRSCALFLLSILWDKGILPSVREMVQWTSLPTASLKPFRNVNYSCFLEILRSRAWHFNSSLFMNKEWGWDTGNHLKICVGESVNQWVCGRVTLWGCFRENNKFRLES